MDTKKLNQLLDRWSNQLLSMERDGTDEKIFPLSWHYNSGLKRSLKICISELKEVLKDETI